MVFLKIKIFYYLFQNFNLIELNVNQTMASMSNYESKFSIFSSHCVLVLCKNEKNCSICYLVS